MQKDFKSPESTIPPRGQGTENVVEFSASEPLVDPTFPPYETENVGTDAQIPAHPNTPIPTTVLTPEFQEAFWSRVNKGSGCWEWRGYSHHSGYGRMRAPGGRAHFRAHRLAWFLAAGKDPGDKLVCHKCDNPACVRPSHLFLGTVKDNADDMHAKGRHRSADQSGENNPRARLNEEKVREIVGHIRAGLTNKRIAEMYGIGHALISCIRSGRAWRNTTLAMGYEPAPGKTAPKGGKTGWKKR